MELHRGSLGQQIAKVSFSVPGRVPGEEYPTAGGKIRAREDGRLAAGGKLAARGAGWPGQVAWATGPGVCIVAAGSPVWAGLAGRLPPPGLAA